MHQYTPILQTKEGELKALEDLTLEEKTKIIPLIQLLPDTNEERVGSYVNDRIKPLLSGWSFLDNRLYVDPALLGVGNTQVMMEFFENLKAGHINIIPVVQPSVSDAVKSYLKGYTLFGLCIRISGSDTSAALINSTIDYYLNYYSLELSEIDLLIDFGVIVKENAGHFYNSLDLLLSRVNRIGSLRKLMVAAGSFPPDLGAFPKDTVTAIPRIEWEFWKRVKPLVYNTVPLVYADYGNVYPIYDDNSKRRGTCSIKYTTTDHFYIFKGEQAKNSPISTGQYQVKAKELINQSYYSGNTFSWGDQYIQDCADQRVSPGSSTTWVKVTQNHHFVKMLQLLRNQNG